MVLARTLAALLAVVALASASFAQEEAPAPPELSTLPDSRPFPGCRTVRFVLPDGSPAADAEIWIVRVVREWARAADPLDVGWASTLRLGWSDAGLVAVDDPYGAVDVERLPHVADAHGRVHVPRGVDHQKLWVRLFRAGVEYRGYADLWYGYDEQPMVELAEVVRAHVLDAEGRAVRGIVVSTVDARAQPIDWIGRTDPRGRVESWGGAHSWRRRTRDGDLILRAETLFEPSIEVEAPRDGSTAVLRAPPSGSVRILVPDAGPARVRLTRAQRPGEVITEVRDGVATFDLVPLGERLEAWVFGPLEAHGPHEFDGPTRPGESVEFELPRASCAVRVTATIVDEHGAPIAERPVLVELDVHDPIRAVHTVTDARGRIAFLAHPEHGVTLRAIDAPGLDDRRLVHSAFVEPVGQRAIDGAVELGALPLVAPPVLARGWCVDDAGRPIEGAHVSASDGSYPPIASDITRADGSFLLRGEADEGWRFSTLIDGFRAPDGGDGGDVAITGDDVVLRFEPTSSVRTRLLVPRGYDRDAFYLTVEDARGKLVRMHDPWIDPGVVNGMPFGGAAAEGLAPGPARLAIHSFASGELAAYDVFLERGATTWLGPLELPVERLETFEITVLDEHGAPLLASVRAPCSDIPPKSFPALHWREPTDGPFHRRVAGGRGTFRVPRPTPDVPLVLWVEDHVPLPIPVPAPGAPPLELRPTRAPEYLLRLADGLAMPAGGWRLRLARVSPDGPPVEPRVSVAELAYRARLGPGRYRAAAVVPYHGEARGHAACEFDVPAEAAADGRREIALPFDPTEWAALLAPDVPGD